MEEILSKCPLCQSCNSTIIGSIDHVQLNKRYTKLTGINFEYLLTKPILLKCCTDCNLQFYDPKIAGDENFYNALQKFEWYYLNDKYEYSIAQKYITPGDIVLDVGCGVGAFSKNVTANGGNFMGLELSDGAITQALSNGIKIKKQTVQEFALNNPNSVDVVTSFQVCEHVDDVKGMIEAKLQALKPIGLMIIAVPSDSSFLKNVSNGILNMPPHHITRWSDEVFEFIAKQYGLKLERIYHEKLQKIHVRGYLNTLVQNSILKPKLVDNSTKRFFIEKLASIISIILEKGFSETMRPNGHTAIAVFRKTIV